MKTRTLVSILLLAFIIITLSLSVQEVSGDGSDRAPFTIIVLPDTQYYSAVNPKIFIQQTEWIWDNREQKNISAVIHLGDITNNNSEMQWENATKALSVIDGNTPLFLVPGNHDIDQDKLEKHDVAMTAINEKSLSSLDAKLSECTQPELMEISNKLFNILSNANSSISI